MTIVEPETAAEPDVPIAPLVLGAAGALPFILAGGAAVFGLAPLGFSAAEIGEAYGAAILSFMGAIHWGMQMGRRAPSLDWALYGASVLPALGAAFALLMPTPWSLFVLAGGLTALLVFDLCLGPKGLVPAWYSKLRWPLTIVAAGSLLIVGVA